MNDDDEKSGIKLVIPDRLGELTDAERERLRTQETCVTCRVCQGVGLVSEKEMIRWQRTNGPA